MFKNAVQKFYGPLQVETILQGKGVDFFLWQVDAAVLQYENQKLVRQLDVQKQELHDLEAKKKELQVKQAAYDDILISINRLWNEVFLPSAFVFLLPDLMFFCSFNLSYIIYILLITSCRLMIIWYFLKQKLGQIQELYKVWVMLIIILEVLYGLVV